MPGLSQYQKWINNLSEERLLEFKEHKKIYGREWSLKNRNKINTNRRRWVLKIKREVLDFYGGKCDCCQETRIEFLSIDHINGGGNKHRQELNISGGKEFYLWLRKNSFPTGYRVLCHNCNQSLGFYHYCPHKEARGDL